MTETRTWHITASSGHYVIIEAPDDIDVLEVKYDMERRRLRITFSSPSDFGWNNAKVQVPETNQP